MSLVKMKEKKDSLMGIERSGNNAGSILISSESGVAGGVKSPQIEIHIMGSALEIVLITGLDFQFMFNETIRVLHEEGADIVNASFSVVEDSVFHTIHSKVINQTFNDRPINLNFIFFSYFNKFSMYNLVSICDTNRHILCRLESQHWVVEQLRG